MKIILLKVAFIMCIASFFVSTRSLAVDRVPERPTALETELIEGEKKANPVNSSKKVKKLTLKQKFKLIKQLRKERRKARKMSVKNDTPIVLLYILAVLLPPVAVGIYIDWDTEPTLINLLLTLIFWLPGIVHAFYILLK